VFPVYFALLDSVTPWEIIADRIVWSFVLLAGIIMLRRSWPEVAGLIRSKRTLGLLAIAAIFLATNWGTYVYAVSIGQVVEGSLGYFINPLVSVALGVVVLKERLRPLQWVALGIALLAVLELTWSYSAVPWIGLVLAFSFGMYGLVKKIVGAKAIPAMAVETSVLFPLAAGYLIIAGATGNAVFASQGPLIAILLVLLGPVTVIPLLAFNGAATRIPLSILGLMQYLTPTVIFLIGVFGFDEDMTTSRWLGFAIIWIALVIFAVDAWRSSREGRRVQDELAVAEPD
jgi:chloramphenicol-sensitive protein RarD